MVRVLDPFATALKPKKPVPFDFVLDRLASLSPHTKPMFGCVAVYVGERIVMVLRDKGAADRDNGVWLVCEAEHEAEVLRAFPRLEVIEIFAGRVRGWHKLSSRSPEFEDDVLRACECIRTGEVPLGKVPGRRAKRPARPRRA